MKTVLSILAGLLIVVAAWVPLNMAGRYDIPFAEAVLAIGGTLVGGIVVLVATVRWVRSGSSGQLN